MDAKPVVDKGFDICLEEGMKSEDHLLHILVGSTIEVKSQVHSTDFGSLFIEYAYKGKPSGIATTTAEYWALEYLPGRFILIPTKELVTICRLLWPNPANRSKGGDGNFSSGIKVPFEYLLYSLKLDSPGTLIGDGSDV